VIRGQMKHRVDSLHRRSRNAGLAQIGAYKFDVARGNVPGNVAQVPAR
jgi:hypothetical protein